MLNQKLEQSLFGTDDDPMTLKNVMICIIVWEVYYQVIIFIFSWSVKRYEEHILLETANKTKFLEAGPSYFVGATHALIVAIRSTYAVIQLYDATLEERNLTMNGYSDEKFVVEVTNLIVLSYFCYDIIHCILQFPKLGSYDMIGHHFGLIIVCYLAGKYNILYFTGSWIVAAEWSTPFLSMRFLLIQSGRGHTTLMKCIELLFAITFFLSRPLSYTIGFINLTWNMPQLYTLLVTSTVVPLFHFTVVMIFIYLAWFLQLFWAKKIINMILKALNTSSKQKVAP